MPRDLLERLTGQLWRDMAGQELKPPAGLRDAARPDLPRQRIRLSDDGLRQGAGRKAPGATSRDQAALLRHALGWTKNG